MILQPTTTENTTTPTTPAITSNSACRNTMVDTTNNTCRNSNTINNNSTNTHTIQTQTAASFPLLPPPTETEADNMLDCPICLNAMTESDIQHPLQCKSKHCDYNFCMHCIENLVAASKDDFQEASDGNQHVKIYLNCPNCRSNLSETIRDTLLIRKADYLVSPQGIRCKSTWTPSQQRLHSVLHHEDIKQAIAKARHYEEEFLRTHHISIAEEWSPLNSYDHLSPLNASDTLSTVSDSEGDYSSKENYDHFALNDGYFSPDEYDDHDSDDDDDEASDAEDECGFEMDLVQGVHKSFRLPRTERLLQKTAKVREDMIDKTLLRGLAPVMTKAEQKKATQLMVSGDVSKLVEAAKMLRSMERNTRRGVTRCQLVKRSSIYGLIDECEQAHNRRKPAITARPSLLTPPPMPRPNPVTRGQSCVRNLENAEFLQSHPLPVRMPKYVEFEFSDLLGPCQLPSLVGAAGFSSVVSSSLFPACFVDDVWNGTIRDAYTRTTLMPLTGSIVRHEPPLNHKGVLNVLGEGMLDQDLGVGRFDVPKSRVMIHSLQGGGSAGKQGILPGDVVTHLNGQEFHGTAKELMKAIEASVGSSNRNCADFGECCVSLVLNAEAPIAEALRRRGNVACLYT
ncbi:unnamed protein product [Cylindrotheca closterium]|uniref:RING-type domain-containing protein n=1 Tax=Cylindrotheca closterium TaxID=2856 RepID=A0AAD2G837_9STRA|nr:unnamed protein product [Cylindrotheca closterium]